MKNYIFYLGFAMSSLSVLSGCSAVTDTIAASSQTFTNVSDSSSGSSTNVSKDSSPSSSNTQRAVDFAQVNWMNLSANMSKGHGEYLMAMAELLKVDDHQKAAFYQMTQQKFLLLFRHGQQSATELVGQLQVEMTGL